MVTEQMQRETKGAVRLLGARRFLIESIEETKDRIAHGDEEAAQAQLDRMRYAMDAELVLVSESAPWSNSSCST